MRMSGYVVGYVIPPKRGASTRESYLELSRAVGVWCCVWFYYATRTKKRLQRSSRHPTSEKQYLWSICEEQSANGEYLAIDHHRYATTQTHTPT